LILLSGCSYKSSVDIKSIGLPEAVDKNASSRDKFWWESLGDEQLNAFIKEALQKSPDVNIAFSRIEASRAALQEQDASLMPTLSTGLDGSKKSTVHGAKVDSESYGFDGTLNYEIDLWGRLRALSDSKEFDLLTTEENYKQSALSLATEISRNWYALGAETLKKELLEDELLIYKDILEIIKLRFANGQVDAVDVYRQQQQIEGLKVGIINTDTSISTLKRALLLLAGKDPLGEFDYNPKLIDVDKLQAKQIDSSLLLYRPDIRASFYTMYSKDALLASKVRDLYPKFDIGLSIFTQATSWPQMFENWVSNLFGAASLVLFDGGAKISRIEAARANLDEAEYLYLKTVLQALKEVEDAYTKASAQYKILDAQKKNYTLAKLSYERNLDMYLSGNDSFLNVLDAQNSFLGSEIDLIDSKAALIEQRITLLNALGTSASVSDFKTLGEKSEQ
jgi:NodT family efflux transporter outer membrane factor (OMF) lipoprotein